MLLNIKDFGAVGDGLTDDTAALQAAINAAAEATDPWVAIFFPEGTYAIGSGQLVGDRSWTVRDASAEPKCSYDEAEYRLRSEVRTWYDGVRWHGSTVNVDRSVPQGSGFPLDPTVGQRVYRDDLGGTWEWDGVRWIGDYVRQPADPPDA